jgi:hypothetical protein
VHYLYRVGFLPKKREPNPKQVYHRFRDDIRYIRRISEEARLLAKHGIDTDVQLKAHTQILQNQLDALNNQRRLLRNKLRGIKDTETAKPIKSEIGDISKSMGIIRKELSLCNEIERRSPDMEEKLRLAQKDKKPKAKELMKNEHVRRRR